MEIIIALFVIAFVLIITGILVGKSEARKKQKVTSDFYNTYTSQGLQVVRKVEQLFLSNQSLPYMTGLFKIYDDMFGIPQKEGEQLKYYDLMGLKGWPDLPENSRQDIAAQYLDDMCTALHARYTNMYQKLQRYNEAEAMKRFGINLRTNEVVCDYSANTDWLEEKTITTSYTYSGLRYSGQGVLRYTFGTLSVIPNTRTYFDIVDRGNLYITNERIIFVGTQNHKNRTIDIDNLLEFTIFKDGILLGKANGKKPLIQFPAYLPKPPKITVQRDHLSRISLALSRVLNNTWNQDLKQ